MTDDRFKRLAVTLSADQTPGARRSEVSGRIRVRGRPKSPKHPDGRTVKGTRDSVQVVLSMPRPVRDVLAAESAKLGVSRSEFVRMAVLAWSRRL